MLSKFIVFWVIFLSGLQSIQASEVEDPLLLNKSEQAWLQEHNRPLKVGLTAIPGQVYVNQDGSHTGLAIDLFQRIEAKSPLHFKFVYFDTWNQVVQAGINKDIDIIFLSQQTAERLKYFNFTKVVVSQQNKIISKIGGAKNLTPNQLAGMKVGVSKGSAIFDYLQSSFPQITLVETNSEKDALVYASQGVIDAAICESVRASFFIEKLNIKNLHVIGDINYNYHLRIASRNDYPILNSILNKTLDKLSEGELPSLHLKWGYQKDREVFLDTQMLIYLAIIFGIIIPFTIYLYTLNRKLKHEINIRKQAYAKLEAAFDEIRTLQGIITICSYCNHIYDDDSGWERLETYISKHSNAKFSHGICVECLPEVLKPLQKKTSNK